MADALLGADRGARSRRCARRLVVAAPRRAGRSRKARGGPRRRPTRFATFRGSAATPGRRGNCDSRSAHSTSRWPCDPCRMRRNKPSSRPGSSRTARRKGQELHAPTLHRTPALRTSAPRPTGRSLSRTTAGSGVQRASLTYGTSASSPRARPSRYSTDRALPLEGPPSPIEAPQGTGRQTVLLRAAPGAEHSCHRHSGVEQCYVIVGDLLDGDVEMRAGDYSRFESGRPAIDARRLPAAHHPHARRPGRCPKHPWRS